MSDYKHKVTKDQWALTGNAFVFALNSDGINRFWFDVCAGFAGKGERASEDEMQANAALCIEASNVLHETNLTPRELAELVDRLRLEAKIHAQEARTANATIAEIYQVCTGSTGEQGNWNGAEPVRELAEQRAELLAAMRGIEDLGSDGEHSGDRHAKCRETARAAIARCEGTKP